MGSPVVMAEITPQKVLCKNPSFYSELAFMLLPCYQWAPLIRTHPIPQICRYNPFGLYLICTNTPPLGLQPSCFVFTNQTQASWVCYNYNLHITVSPQIKGILVDIFTIFISSQLNVYQCTLRRIPGKWLLF